MAIFNEAQLEQAFVELFKREGYYYVHGENIIRDTRDVILYDDLRHFLQERYKAEGITEDEINRAIAKLETSEGGGVYAENVEALRLLQDGFSLKRSNPQLPNLYVYPIDYAEIKNNTFKFVNQFAIDGEHHRIPDGIVFVNGLPLVVLEFKNAIKQNTTIENAYKQLTNRYRRDIPKLFRYNAFVVISDGVNNKIGSLFAPYEFFYGWHKAEATDSVLDGAFDTMFTMMHGLFRKERLMDVVHNFIFLPDTPKAEDKIVCRYPQYFATTLLYDNILKHSRLNPKGDGKGGTYFGATGCGKSYTMLFLARQLMRSKKMSSPTIILITDRTDLDAQLSKSFLNSKKFIGDKVIVQVKNREKLKQHLENRSAGGVYLTTIQKFEEGTGLLSNRANIICISDEAHRSQVGIGKKTAITEKGVKHHYGFAKYLRDSFPNATYVGFTGTPLDNTLDVFGPIVDRYTMTEAVADEITCKIVYEGRAAKAMLDSAQVKEIENFYKQCQQDEASDYQIEESKKTMTRIDVILNAPDLLAKIAQDIVAHYIESLRKVNKQKGVDFTKRLEDIVKKYNDRSDDAALANDVIDDVVGEMVKLMEDVVNERTAGDTIGLSFEEKAFFDILKSVAVKYDFIDNFPDEKLTSLAKQVKEMVEEQSDVADWMNRTDLRATLKMNVIVLLARAGYPPKIRDEVFKEILEQAENFKRHSRSRPYVIDNNSYSSMVAEP